MGEVGRQVGRQSFLLQNYKKTHSCSKHDKIVKQKETIITFILGTYTQDWLINSKTSGSDVLWLGLYAPHSDGD